MSLTDKQIIEKAKNTPYKHRAFFLEGGKSVYDAISYFVKCGDFYVTVPRNIKYTSQVDGYNGPADKEAIVKWLIDTKQYDKLIIKYAGREGGTDKGKLKLQTFLILKGYKNVDIKGVEKFSVILSSCGNVDYGQNPYEVYNGVVDRIYYADTIEELQKEVRRYIEDNGLGGGNYTGGEVKDKSGKIIGKISYNGRYWDIKEYNSK